MRIRNQLNFKINMRKLLIVVIVILSNICFAQDHIKGVMPLNEKNEVVYEGIDSLPGTSAQQIYSRAKSWIFEAFNSGKDVLQLDDKENFTGAGRGNFTNYWQSAGQNKMTVYFTIKIVAKDGRYKYTLSNINLDYYLYEGKINQHYISDVENWQVRKKKVWREKNVVKYLSTLNTDIEKNITALKKYMVNPTESTKSNW